VQKDGLCPVTDVEI
jgi:hypothetical protein